MTESSGMRRRRSNLFVFLSRNAMDANSYFGIPAKQVIEVGFPTLSQLSVFLDELPPALAGRLPRYPRLPVTLLGRLAVDRRYRGHGFGARLLLDALHRAWRVGGEIASFAVFVEALDEEAAGFYPKFGFVRLPDQPLRLVLPMSTLQQLFAAVLCGHTNLDAQGPRASWEGPTLRRAARKE